MTIYVSNVGCHVTSADLNQLFAAIGVVASAHIITDKETGKSLRYGFVEMPDEKSGNEAIIKLHGKVIEGRMMSVSISKVKSLAQAKPPLRREQAAPFRQRRFA